MIFKFNERKLFVLYTQIRCAFCFLLLPSSLLATSAAELNADLMIKSGRHPIISSLNFNHDTQMAVTVCFKTLNPAPGTEYKHALLCFEYYLKGNCLRYTLHLGADGELDRCYGYGTNAKVSELKDAEILPKLIGDYGTDEDGDSYRNPPTYARFVSFVVSKNINEIKMQAEADRRTIKFSLLADLWSEHNYNCCSYANKILHHCGLDIEKATAPYLLGLAKIQTDTAFIQALRDYTVRREDGTFKFH